MTRDDRQPIVVADSGPLIRLAAAGLLDLLLGLNRRVVIVDRVEEEVTGDPEKPFAREIGLWLDRMGDSLLRAPTVVGEGVRSLRNRSRNAAEDALLKAALRNSGEQAIREFVDNWKPTETASALVLYEDRKVPGLFLDAEFPVEFMTTRAFAQQMQHWGINENAVAALETVAGLYDLKPALWGRFDPDTPPDQRELPSPRNPSP